MDDNSRLSTNSIAFIGLSNEYCNLIESSRETEREDFINTLLKLLPRIYIAATDIKVEEDTDMYITPFLDEDYYENMRMYMGELFGPDDTYLEVFENDMKYSDSPIGASISEGLADIYQDLYNFIANVKDAPKEISKEIISVCKENFEIYWGQKLCNVLRAIHKLKYNSEI